MLEAPKDPEMIEAMLDVIELCLKKVFPENYKGVACGCRYIKVLMQFVQYVFDGMKEV